MFSPELAPAIVSNPAAVIAGTAGGAAAGMAGRIGASLFGASPETERAVGDAAAITGALLGGRAGSAVSDRISQIPPENWMNAAEKLPWGFNKFIRAGRTLFAVPSAPRTAPSTSAAPVAPPPVDPNGSPQPANVGPVTPVSGGVLRIGQTPVEAARALANGETGTVGTRAAMMHQLRMLDKSGPNLPDNVIQRFDAPEYTPRPNAIPSEHGLLPPIDRTQFFRPLPGDITRSGSVPQGDYVLAAGKEAALGPIEVAPSSTNKTAGVAPCGAYRPDA